MNEQHVLPAQEMAEKSASRLDVMTEAQKLALYDFREAHGRNWKSALQGLWASGKDSGELRQIRNQHAELIPSLRDEDFAHLEAEEAKKVVEKEGRKAVDMERMNPEKDRLSTDWENLDSVPGMRIRLNSRDNQVKVQTLNGGMASFSGAAAAEEFAHAAELSEADRGRMVRLANLGQMLEKKGMDLSDVSLAVSGRLIGSVMGVADGKVLQETGQGNLVSHDAKALEEKLGKVPKPGDRMDVRYSDRMLKAAEMLGQDGQSVSVTLNTR